MSSKMKFPATIIFLTVAGEEQGLNGSGHFAKMAKEQGWNLEAVLNNDIVGGDKSAEQDHSVVRVFSEGVPAAATEQDIRRIRGLGGESDSGSRQLARYIADVGRTYSGEVGVKPMLCSGWTATCAAATIFHFSSKDLPRCASRRFAKISIISIRTCARKTASNTETC